MQRLYNLRTGSYARLRTCVRRCVFTYPVNNIFYCSYVVNGSLAPGTEVNENVGSKVLPYQRRGCALLPAAAVLSR